MIVSHRSHGPYWNDSSLHLDRVMTNNWVVRRAALCGFTADGRVSKPLGSGVRGGRARLTFVLEGRMRLFFVDGTTRDLAAGDVAMRSRVDEAEEAGFGTTLEFDFESVERVFTVVGSLGARAGTTVSELANMTRVVAPETLPSFQRCLDATLSALRAEGFDVPVISCRPTDADPNAQRHMSALDRALSDLANAPALVDLQSALHCSRRTIVRRTHSLCDRYAMYGMGNTDFRSVRDFYRLLVASILLTHSSASTDDVSRCVGYASPAALCHVFRRVGLPSPSVVGQLAQQ